MENERSSEARVRAKQAMQKLEDKFDILLDKLFRNIDPSDAAVYLGVAGIGYQTFGDWRGAVYGMVSLKLATAPGGTPPVSQVAGLAGLAALGIATFVGFPGIVDLAEQTIKPIMPGGYVPSQIYDWKAAAESCSPGGDLGKVRGYLYGYRGRNLDQIADMLIKNGYREIVECANTKTDLTVGFSYTVCECDVNEDGIVDIKDIAEMQKDGQTTKAEYCSRHHFHKKCTR